MNLYQKKFGKKNSHLWGYQDTYFSKTDNGHVILNGDRYIISGYELPYFLDELKDALELDESEPLSITEPNTQCDIVKSTEDPAQLIQQLTQSLSKDQVTTDSNSLLSCAHGQQSVDEIVGLFYCKQPVRVPDVVVFPRSESDVVKVVKLADEMNAVIQPYGGGTNVTGALTIPLDEQRLVISVNMQWMNELIDIDEENNIAHFQSGITGLAMESLLRERGFTCGHEPDSVEFSTLGGWISTNASGMKKNTYGNIEQIVKQINLVTPKGKLQSLHNTPRNSLGVDLKQILFGSEGSLGVITSATIKIHRVPEVTKYGCFVFRNFQSGIGALKAIQESQLKPASIRFVNNLEFRLGQSLTPKKTLKKKLQEFFLYKVLKFDKKKICAAIAVFEGSKELVNLQEKNLKKICSKHKAVPAGETNGMRGYFATLSICYIRDFMNKMGIIGETFETTVPWSKISEILQRVEQALEEFTSTFNIPGKPYLGYRITQLYQSGVCLYFTLGFFTKGLKDPVGIYKTIETELRKIILESSGSLSHHHGIGKLRQDFILQLLSPQYVTALRDFKKSFDPNDMFALQNGVFRHDD